MTRRYAALVALVAVFAFYFRAFFPGYLTADTVYILNMAAGLEPVSNWHPNFNIWMNRQLLALFEHIESIWLVQAAAWIGVAWLAASRLPHLHLPAFLLITLLPPITANMAASWKDDWAVIVTLATFAAALWQRDVRLTVRSGSSNGAWYLTAPTLLVCVLGAAATAIRVDYLAIVGPIAVAAGWWLLDAWMGLRVSWVKKLAIAATVSLASIIILKAVIGVVFAVEVERDRNPWATIAAWDIAGVAVRTDHQVDLLGQNFSGEDLKAGYNCRTSDPLFFGNFIMPGNPPQEDLRFDLEDESAEYRAAWVRAVTAEPGAYLAHRWCVITEYLGFGETVHYAYPFGAVANPYGLEFERSRANIDLYFLYDAVTSDPIWRPWFWLLVATVSGAIVAATGAPLVGFALATSAWASAARGLVLPAADIRYALWIFVAGSVSLVAALAYTRVWLERRAKTRRL
ncbi:hypothetical protein JF546_04140 [Nitratireductor aquimarinus]|uniref:hypothetical protein n=1 Tax=Nitratireductor aquimarinus TaxID=889300 RepID=UPI001A8D76BF|nr:hypothetical protein [Nitratireductor aquimarinus]MBN8242196.1 hypothetical protein [Nitratireductor aquimarinus]MBY6130582.1 hypothetical protein [Nitratireductor aquimarinus]MCA1302662.1 hypothetical protein [Nitratireductor aquimarinus]